MGFQFFKRFRFQLLLIGALPLIAFLLINTLFINSTLRNSMIQEKKGETQKLVYLVLSIMHQYYGLEQEEDFLRAKAQEEAKNTIRAIRTGEGIQDYFWIIDYQPKMIVHPFREELEGKDLSEFRDPQGKRIFVEMLQLVEGGESAFISYHWEYFIQGEVVVEPKLSYVASFEPWEWIVGTGINMREIEGMIAPIRSRILLLTGVIAIVFFTALVLLTSLIEKKTARGAEGKGILRE